MKRVLPVCQITPALIILLWGLYLAGTRPAFAAPLTVVDNGIPRAVIVVAADEPHARKAGDELAKYIGIMSGATVPAITEGEAAPVGVPVRILVGHTKAAAQLGVTVPSGYDPTIRKDWGEEEGWTLQTKGQSIVVGGNSDGPYQGTLYAAYNLLERLGCRWYFPGKWGQIVPSRKTVIMPELNIVSRPDFSNRGIWLSGWVRYTRAELDEFTEWGVKNGFSTRDFYPPSRDGSLAGLLPPSEYADTHPEYYALGSDGTRKVTPKKPITATMLCLSNPAVFTESVANLKLAFAGKKKLRITNASLTGFGISSPDGTPACNCPDCLASSQNFNFPNYIHQRMQSEEFFGFASRLAKEFPDKWVATTAYALREMPPQGVTLPPNISVMYAPIASCVLHAADDLSCWRRQETMQILRNWTRLSNHVTISDYNPGFLSGSFVPERDVYNFTRNAPLYKKIGVKGFVSEGRKAWMQTWLSYYIRAKLMWDVNADVAALKKDFYNTFFGPHAGPHVQAWWDATEDALGSAAIHVHEDWLVNHVYTTEFTKRIHAHVEAALKSEMTPEQRARCEAFAIIADYLEAYAAMEDADLNMRYADSVAASGRMVENMKKLSAIYSYFFTVDERTLSRSVFPIGRRTDYLELAAKTVGEKGTLLAAVPVQMKFQRDPYNEGVIERWYDLEFNDAGWGAKNTFYTWDAQDKPEDARGHDYDGYGWYRETIEIPAGAVGKPATLWLGGLLNEGWVWINGEYAGHRPWHLWWHGKKDFEMDVTRLLKSGKNTLAIRVYNNAEIGGMLRRGFIYQPKAEPVSVAAG